MCCLVKHTYRPELTALDPPGIRMSQATLSKRITKWWSYLTYVLRRVGMVSVALWRICPRTGTTVHKDMSNYNDKK